MEKTDERDVARAGEWGKVSELAKTSCPSVHRLAAAIYWVSLIVLLVGVWILIDPYNRRPGQLTHVYITLLSFEIYMWLLLVLGKWQLGRCLNRDACRTGIFLIVLTGFLFIALNPAYFMTVDCWRFFGAIVVFWRHERCLG